MNLYKTIRYTTKILMWVVCFILFEAAIVFQHNMPIQFVCSFFFGAILTELVFEYKKCHLERNVRDATVGDTVTINDNTFTKIS